MEAHPNNPDAESEHESAGVGSDAESPSSESSLVDRQAEIRELDTSLSAMTDLLLSDDDELDLGGEFAEVGAHSRGNEAIPEAEPAAQPTSPPDSDGQPAEPDPGDVTAEPETADDPSEQPDDGPDALEQVEQVQAAVEAALEDAATELDTAPETPVPESGEAESAVSEDAASDPDAGLEPQPVQVAEAADASSAGDPEDGEPGATDPFPETPGEPALGDVEALMSAVSEELDRLDAEADAGSATRTLSDVEDPSDEPVLSEPDAFSGHEPSFESETEPEFGQEPVAVPDSEPAGTGEGAGGTPASEAPEAFEASPDPTPTPGSATDTLEEPIPAGEPALDGPVAAVTPEPPAPTAGSAPDTKPVVSPESVAARAPALHQRVWVVARRLGGNGSAKLGDALADGLEPLADRWGSQSRVLRQSLAWVALWTAFNAACVWGFLVLFRTGGTDADGAGRTEIAGADAALVGEASPDVGGNAAD